MSTKSRIPAVVSYLLEKIGQTEAPNGYDTIFGNRQKHLSKPVTKMTLAEVQANQSNWGNKTWVKRNWGYNTASSATGYYQFMNATLKGIIEELKLDKSRKFDKNLQDDLGWFLLRRRGLDAWLFGRIDDTEFAKRLAQEWASFPVLKGTRGAHRNVNRGQSYYAGDGLNNALVPPEKVELWLKEAKALAGNSPVHRVDEPEKSTTIRDACVGVGAGGTGAVVAVEQTPDGTLETVLDHVGMFGYSGSTVLATIGSLIMIGIVGYTVYRMIQKRKG